MTKEGTFQEDSRLTRALRSLGPDWSEWLAANAEQIQQQQARQGTDAGLAAPGGMAAGLEWLKTHPSPDAEYTRLYAEYLRIPELLREYKHRFGHESWAMDDPRTQSVLDEAQTEIERREANLRRRTIELLRGH